MILNYIKIAFRTILKNKSYTILNVVGLSIGLVSAFLIFALVHYHFNFEKHNSKIENIYRLTSQFFGSDGNGNTSGVPYPFGKAFKTDFPQIPEVCMTEELYNPMVMLEEKGNIKKIKDDNDTKAAFVQPNYFRIFDFKWLEGSPNDLKNPNMTVISKNQALKYFGSESCIGKTFKLEGRIPLKIVGVYDDAEINTDFPYLFMVSYSSLKDFLGTPELDDNFSNTNSSSQCFVLLNEKFTVADWGKQMTNFVKKHKPNGVKDTSYIMTNLKDIHFQPDLGVTSKNLVLSLLFIGIFLIITACINFVNLATAQALKRSKEVGVRKVMGSTKRQLFWQFMFETALIALISLAIAVGLFYLTQPIFYQNLTGIFKFTFSFTPVIFLYILLIITAVIVFSGSYPALVLGGFQPVMALKGKITTHQLGGFSVRRSLVVLQFAISQMLIIGMLIVANQLNFFTSKDLGFKKDAIVTVELPFERRQDLVKMSTFKNLVNQIPSVEKFSYSMSGPPQSGWTNSTSMKFDNRPEDEDFSPHMKSIDDKYCDLYQIKFVAGRNLMQSDTIREALVNETMVKKLRLKKPEDIINKIITTGNGKRIPVVGVVKDFHMSSLHQPISPLYMTTSMTNIYNANLKLNSNNYKNTIASLEKAFNKVYVNSYFKANFVDDQIAKNYETEKTMGKLINLFAIIAILIGCLGLYGLVSFMAAQKTKEIGIRKVLGANEGQILGLFGKEFGKLIFIAFAIAAPTAWYFMNKWLMDFEYRESINAKVFVYALGITFFIALVTIGYQSIKAAWANPVKSLRSE